MNSTISLAGVAIFIAFLISASGQPWPPPSRYLTVPGCSCATSTSPDLPAFLFVPPEASPSNPVPIVVGLHGHTGLWSTGNCTPQTPNPLAAACFNQTMQSNFEEWSMIFMNISIAVIYIDSFTPRGIIQMNESYRPSYEQGPPGYPINDAVCSPTRNRPTDAYCALKWIRQQNWVNQQRVGVIGWSMGGETGLGVSISTTIRRDIWSVYYQGNTSEYYISAPPPPRWSFGDDGFNVSVLYYPGCFVYCYYGNFSCEDTHPNNYMPGWPTLIMHGTADPIYQTGEIGILVAKSFNHGLALGMTAAQYLQLNPLVNVTFQGAAHSFDDAPPVLGGQLPTADQLAQQQSRQLATQWFTAYLLGTSMPTTPPLLAGEFLPPTPPSPPLLPPATPTPVGYVAPPTTASPQPYPTPAASTAPSGSPIAPSSGQPGSSPAPASAAATHQPGSSSCSFGISLVIVALAAFLHAG